jgi:succinate dehydrogenase / fumarate reductase iron-sulfur subunit
MLFTSAKNTQLNSLPQGQPQRDQRTLGMVTAMRTELFGSCTNHGECEAVCPKQIPMEFIGKMNQDLMRAMWHRRREPLVIHSIVQAPSTEGAHEHHQDAANGTAHQSEVTEHAGTRQ